MDTSDQSPIEQYASIGQRVSELKRMVTLVGSNLLRCDPSKPAPQALPSLHPFGDVNIAAISAEFETTLLALRSELHTFASWQSSPDVHVSSTLKQLLGNTQSHARWNKRKEAVKHHLAETQMSAMAYSEHRLSLHSKTAMSAESARNGGFGAAGGAMSSQQNGIGPSDVNANGFSYEHDLETRKHNLINRFEFISQLVFGKPVYTNIIEPEETLFLADPSANSGGPSATELLELQRTGIIADAKSMLQLTLASDYSIMDIQVDAFGKYVQVAYEYDLPSKYVSRWVLEALTRGEVRMVERLVASSYMRRCLRHHSLCQSLQSQYLEATKTSENGVTNPQTTWAVPNLNLPQVSSLHQRLMCLERDLVLLARLETLKYGLLSLSHGMGWMTMNARGPLITFYVHPFALASSASYLKELSLKDAKSSEEYTSAQLDISTLLASASEEHMAYTSDLPPLDLPHPQEMTHMPAYTSNVLAPVLLAKLKPGTSLCSYALGQTDPSGEHAQRVQQPAIEAKVGENSLSFHVEVEQGCVSDPTTLRRVGFAPCATTSSIASIPIIATNPTLNYTGTMHSMTPEDLPNFFGFFAPSAASNDATLEDPSQFANLGIQWSPFGQIEAPEDEHLPICAKLNLETEMPFQYALFRRLRAIAASSDPIALITWYFQTDEAHRMGKTPPAAIQPPKPKTVTLRIGKPKATAATTSTPPSAPAEPKSTYKGATLASLYAQSPVFSAANSPIVEDVVLPFIESSTPQSQNQNSYMVRCLHSHSVQTSPSCLMIRTIPFVDSRQIRALVSILRQQSAINSIYTSCFLADHSMAFTTYIFQSSKVTNRDTNDLRSSASGVGHNTRHLQFSSASVGGSAPSVDILASPKNRTKRSRAEMEAVLKSPSSSSTADYQSHHAHSDMNASITSLHGTNTLAQAREALCKLTIELGALSEPLFGWSVMVKCIPSGSTSSRNSTTQLGQTSTTQAKKAKMAEAPADASDVNTLLFSFAIHVAIDGYIHVTPSDMETVLQDKRTVKRLENLLRATHDLPLSLQHWLKEFL